MRKIRITARPDVVQEKLIPVVKAIRTAWGLGLKDAKDLADGLRNGNGAVTVELPYPSRESLADLQQYSILVHAQTTSLQIRIKQLLVAAVKADELELADDLLMLYKKYYKMPTG
jgi:hypothetical protein